jgi:hypothetical protein
MSRDAARTPRKHGSRPKKRQTHHSNLVNLASAGKEWLLLHQLGKNAANAPHVYGRAVVFGAEQ